MLCGSSLNAVAHIPPFGRAKTSIEHSDKREKEDHRLKQEVSQALTVSDTPCLYYFFIIYQIQFFLLVKCISSFLLIKQIHPI